MQSLKNANLRLEACLPYGLYALAEIVEDVAALNTATGWQETTNDAGDVAADIEFLRVIHTDAFYTQAEATYARQNNRFSFLFGLIIVIFIVFID